MPYLFTNNDAEKKLYSNLKVLALKENLSYPKLQYRFRLFDSHFDQQQNIFVERVEMIRR